MAKTHQPGLIILNIAPDPAKDLRLCQRLKVEEETHHIPIILVAKPTQLESLTQGLTMGGADFVTSPFQYEDLVVRIHIQLNLWASPSGTSQDRRLSTSPILTGEEKTTPPFGPETPTSSLLKKIDRLTRSNIALEQALSDEKEDAMATKEAFDQSQLLLQEIHHRVKNNLQVIESLLGLQMDQYPDPQIRNLFQDTRFRVHAMALVHEQLYKQQTQGTVELEPYLRLIIQYLQTSLQKEPTQILVRVEAENISLSLHRAIPCGLLVTELVSNCYKHAFSSAYHGAIFVSLAQTADSQYCLQVRDDGSGLPNDLDIRKTTSLGMQLIIALVEHQLGGRIEITRNPGTTFSIFFPHDESS